MKRFNRYGPWMTILMVLLIVFTAMSYFRLVTLMALNAQVDTLSQEVSTKDQMEYQLQAIQEEIREIKVQLEGFERRLPKEVEMDVLLLQLHQIAEQSGLKIIAIQPQGLSAEGSFPYFSLDLSAEGRFPQFYHFLYLLGEIPRLTAIKKISVSSDGMSGRSHLDLQLNALLAKEGDKSL
jgi:Tfp pilus assembly protein PilO